MKFFNAKKSEEKKTTNIGVGTLYELNKNLVEKQVPVLTQDQMEEKKELVQSFINKTQNNYYMLLCSENKDYTIFHRNRKSNNGEFLDLCEGYDGDRIEKVLIDECLPNRGQVKSISLTENEDAIEIWISIDKESFVYYFFPYDTALIEC